MTRILRINLPASAGLLKCSLNVISLAAVRGELYRFVHTFLRARRALRPHAVLGQDTGTVVNAAGTTNQNAFPACPGTGTR